MNRKIFRSLALLGGIAFLSSCGAKLRPLTSEQVTADPTPLSVVGDQVPARIRISFPAKSFPKKATLRITPVLRYAGGEKWGQSYRYQGEQVMGNERTISYTQGNNVELIFSVPYTPEMYRSDLYLTFDAKVGKREVKLPDLKIGRGVVATETLATIAGIFPAEAPHGFERVIKEAFDANILFVVGQANVRSSEINKEDVEEWRYIVQNADETPNQRVSVEVQAYASPEGGQKLNERLSASRERNTNASLRREFRKHELGDIAIDAHYTAQDWEGFRKLVEESDLPDKDLVLRILQMYPDPETREREIRNISSVFRQLTDDVLPKLRRSRLIANVEIIGKTDEEIQDWIARAPGYLTIEELLYAATLAPASAEKMRILQIVNQKYPLDYRAASNIGALYFQQGQLEHARTWFAEAAKRADNPVTKMNQGLIALLDGDTERATTLIASGVNLPELGQALGYLYLKQGDYAKATASFGETISDNAAVAQIVSGDYAKALKTLSAITYPSARTHLLRAIVGARTNDAAAVASGLKAAVTADPAMAYRLADNLEFANFLTHPEVAPLIPVVR